MSVNAIEIGKDSPSFLSRLVPKGLVSATLFWTLLPALLYLSTLTLSFLQPATHTPMLSCLFLVVPFAIIRYRVWAASVASLSLGIFFAYFYNAVPQDERLFQLGLFSVCALDFFILSFSLDELKTHLASFVDLSNNRSCELHQSRLDRQKQEEAMEKIKEELTAKVSHLEENLQRSSAMLEKAKERFFLVESEVELLTEQKTQLISDAFEARKLAHERLASVGAVAPAELVRENSRLEGLYSQLREQFAQKSHMLDATRVELHQMEGRNVALEKELSLPTVSEGDYLRALQRSTEKIDQMECAINSLEALVSHVLNQ